MMQSGFSVDDLLNIDVLSDAQISPAGDRVAYVVARNGASKRQSAPESRVWVVRVEDTDAWEATLGPGTDRAPRWSPDGSRLAFLSDRETRGTAQVYLLDAFPREARKLTDLHAGVTEYVWSPNGTRLAVTAKDHVPESDNDVKLFDAERRFQRLYLVDVESGSASPVNHGDLQVWEFCFSPDGRSIAAIVSDEPHQWAWYNARLIRIDVDSGDVTALYQSERQIARPAWSPDGARIALITCRWSDPGMTGGDLILIDPNGGDTRNLTEGETRSHLQASWLPESDQLVTIAWDHGRAQICLVGMEGGSRPRWTGEQSISDYAFSHSSESGKVAMALSSRESTGEVWVGDLNASDSPTSLRQVTAPGSGAEQVPVLESIWLTWESVDGRTIEGLYVHPDPESGPDSPPPMVTLIHGGPTAVASIGYRVAGPNAWIPFLRQRGIAVFLPNFRGSNGYGVEFAEANIGDLGGGDLDDVMTGVDECIDRGLADAARLGIGGWSYGGYMTARAITRTDRFKAAVAGASITNWYSFHGGTSVPGFASQFVGASLSDIKGMYGRISPLFASDQVLTPTLFLHGEQDPVCPVGQAYEMTRALRQGGVETECVVYPREPHGIGEREHRRDMIERGVGWFATHLGVT